MWDHRMRVFDIIGMSLFMWIIIGTDKYYLSIVLNIYAHSSKLTQLWYTADGSVIDSNVLC